MVTRAELKRRARTIISKVDSLYNASRKLGYAFAKMGMQEQAEIMFSLANDLLLEEGELYEDPFR